MNQRTVTLGIESSFSVGGIERRVGVSGSGHVGLPGTAFDGQPKFNALQACLPRHVHNGNFASSPCVAEPGGLAEPNTGNWTDQRSPLLFWRFWALTGNSEVIRARSPLVGSWRLAMIGADGGQLGNDPKVGPSCFLSQGAEVVLQSMGKNLRKSLFIALFDELSAETCFSFWTER